jgi:Vam6/Vps39-like protein vacuolar protein sorting-associated protein 39
MHKDDPEEKLEPTIRYLQNLDAEHINVILEASHWVLEEDSELGLEIFTADTGKVSSFPRLAIVQDLENFSPLLCIRYLEFIIATFGESEPALHEKLLFLYLRRATELGQSGRKEERAEVLAKLLAFLKISRQYDAERVLGRLPPTQEDLYEIRAVLLGRMGQHDAALSIYVHVLKNVSQAEEYCKRVWSSRESEEDRQVFFTLIKVLLHPEQTRAAAAVLRSSTAAPEKKQQLDSASGLTEALGIIARHGPRIDAVAVFELLPPLVPMQRLHAFATRVLQVTSAERHDAQILSPLLQAREHQLDHGLMALKARSVKITDSRLCARCGKRLGNSAGLTVHAVTGSVTHYFCREDGNAVDEAISRRMRLQDLYL